MRTVRVYYQSIGGELLYFEFQCHWKTAETELSRLKPSRYVIPSGTPPSYSTYSNPKTISMAVRVEIVHPKLPLVPDESARRVVLPSQQQETA